MIEISNITFDSRVIQLPLSFGDYTLRVGAFIDGEEMFHLNFYYKILGK